MVANKINLLLYLSIQKVLYSPSSDAVTIWWTDFGDLESGIKNFQVRLLNGADSCIAESAENMTTIVGWTALPANSTSYTFAHIHLQVCVLTTLSVLEFVDMFR